MIRPASNEEKQKTDQLKKIRRENHRITECYCDYLNRMPRFVTPDMVSDLKEACGIGAKDAFRTLFTAACGLDTSLPADRALEKDYIIPGLFCLDPEIYRNDAYCQSVRFPEISVGKWSFRTENFLPYEPFVCGDPRLLPDYREIPQIGYFEERYDFPSVLENGVEWMTVTPNEVETMRRPIADAHGDVLTFGLGLGYFVFHVSAKENVRSVTVIERDPALIAMFREYLLPQFPHPEKVRVVCADAFDYLQNTLPGVRFDFAFADLWHDASDGLGMYLKFKRSEKNFKDLPFSYWIEPTLLSFLRDMVAGEIFREDGPVTVTHYAQIAGLLSDESLRKMAPNLRNAE